MFPTQIAKEIDDAILFSPTTSFLVHPQPAQNASVDHIPFLPVHPRARVMRESFVSTLVQGPCVYHVQRLLGSIQRKVLLSMVLKNVPILELQEIIARVQRLVFSPEPVSTLPIAQIVHLGRMNVFVTHLLV